MYPQLETYLPHTIYKVLVQLNSKKKIQFRNGQRNWLDIFPKRTDDQQYIKRCSKSLIIGKMQTKTTRRHHLTPVNGYHWEDKITSVGKQGVQATCSPTQNCKFTYTPFFCSSVFVSVCVSNVWPKTTLLSVWPRDAKRLDTPVREKETCTLLVGM